MPLQLPKAEPRALTVHSRDRRQTWLADLHLVPASQLALERCQCSSLVSVLSGSALAVTEALIGRLVELEHTKAAQPPSSPLSAWGIGLVQGATGLLWQLSSQWRPAAGRTRLVPLGLGPSFPCPLKIETLNTHSHTHTYIFPRLCVWKLRARDSQGREGPQRTFQSWRNSPKNWGNMQGE